MSLLSFSIEELGGCGRAADQGKDGTAPLPASIAADSSTAPDAGAPASSEAFSCPAPDASRGQGSGGAVWARDLASGSCCYYDAPFLTPDGWALFDSQSECENSCRCADVEPESPIDPSASVAIQAALRRITQENISLECFCGAGFACYRTLEEASGTLCAPDAAPSLGAVVQRSGCGLVELDVSGGYAGESWVFDAATGALVGAEVASDVQYRPCRSVTTQGGRAFSCSDTVTECQLCGAANGDIKACP